MDIFNNAWIVGIGGGIISGLIVFFVTSKIFSRRERKEYLQRLMTANNEILYAVRPIIVEQKLPTEEILNSLLHSTAKKYTVKFNELFSNKEIADYLTKEIMDNPFLTSENKLKYCEITNSLRELGLKKETETKVEIQYIDRERPLSKEFLSTTLALMTTLMVTITVFVLYFQKEKFNTSNDGNLSITKLLPVLVVMTIVPVVALFMSKFFQMMRKMERDKDKQKQDKINEAKTENETNDN
jgi:hypothetical protein